MIIPTGQSETENRRTDDAIAKKKRQTYTHWLKKTIGTYILRLRTDDFILTLVQ
jgi:hypothetical protein